MTDAGGGWRWDVALSFAGAQRGGPAPTRSRRRRRPAGRPAAGQPARRPRKAGRTGRTSRRRRRDRRLAGRSPAS